MSAEDLHGVFPPDGLFRTTHWSVVLAAREGDATGTARALELLCRSYWPPLYSFVRRRGFSPADAQDLTQEFFARLLQRDFLRNIAREKGRFRTFLLTSLKNFLASEWHKERAAKRGGGQSFVSWEEMEAEERFAQEPRDEVTPERLFEQRWALTVMQQAMQRLRDEFQSAGKPDQFERLKPYLSREGSKEEYTALAGTLGVSSGAVTVAVHRFRRRYGEVLRSVVSHTVAGPDEVEEEVRFLAERIAL